MSPSGHGGTPVSTRALGLGSATALVVACMVGTGVFTTSGFLLADLGSPAVVLLVWLVGGVIAALGALCYGALARRLPESGGEYVFLSRTLHPAAGYLAGWVSLLVGFSAPLAAVALAFAEYARPFVGPAPPARVLASALLLAATALHAASLVRGARVHALAVGVEILLIVAFIAVGASRLSLPVEAVAPPARGGLGAFAVSLVWVSFSYAGWNAAVYLGGEVKDPDRNLPRAMLLGAGVVTALYLALNAVFVLAAPPAALAGQLEVGRIAAEALGGRSLALVVSGLIAFVLVTCASSLVMAGPQVYARMAADGYLPRFLAARTGQPPRAALLLQLAVALALVWTARYDSLLTYVGFMLGLSSAATVLGLVRLRLRLAADLPVPGWPLVPALYLVFVLGATGFTVSRRPAESLAGLATLSLGLLAFAWQRRRMARS